MLKEELPGESGTGPFKDHRAGFLRLQASAPRTSAGVDNENGQPGVVGILPLLLKNNEKCAVLTFVFAAFFVPALC